MIYLAIIEVYQQIKSQWQKNNLWCSTDQQAALNALYETLQVSQIGKEFNGYLQVDRRGLNIFAKYLFVTLHNVSDDTWPASGS